MYFQLRWMVIICFDTYNASSNEYNGQTKTGQWNGLRNCIKSEKCYEGTFFLENKRQIKYISF